MDCGKFLQLGDFGRSDGHGLIDDEVFAGFENLAGHLEVGSAGGGHDQQSKRIVFQHGFKGAIGCHAGIPLRGQIRVALDDGGQFQAFY